MALAAVRNAVLARVGWDVETRGLFGAPEITVCIGDEAHATLGTALQYLGLGRERVLRINADGQGRMDLDALERRLSRVRGPLIVFGQAGNVNTGACDPLAGIADRLTERPDAWLHVDGAFGPTSG